MLRGARRGCPARGRCAVLLSAEQVRSSCPPGRDEPQRSRHRVHLRPLAPSKSSRRCGSLHGPSRPAGNPFILVWGIACWGGGWGGRHSPDSVGEGGGEHRGRMALQKDASRGVPVGVSLDSRLSIYCNVLLQTKGHSLISSSFSAPLSSHEVA